MRWYNNEHRHSRIRFVTPAEPHRGLDHQILGRAGAVTTGWQVSSQRSLVPDRGSVERRDRTGVNV